MPIELKKKLTVWMWCMIRLLFSTAIVVGVFGLALMTGLDPVHIAVALALVMASDAWLRCGVIVAFLNKVFHTGADSADSEPTKRIGH